jgi:hypothetical protein
MIYSQEELGWRIRAFSTHHGGPEPVMLDSPTPEDFASVERWLADAGIAGRADTHNDVGGGTDTVEKNRLGKLAELVFCKHYNLDVQMVVGSDGGSDVTMPSGLRVDVKSTDSAGFADLMIPYDFDNWGKSDVFVLVYRKPLTDIFAIMGWYDCQALKKAGVRSGARNPVLGQHINFVTECWLAQTHELNSMETFDE